MTIENNWKAHILASILTTGFLASGMILPVVAQVTSDGTTKTIVNSNGNIFTIINGTAQGNNLFHSFSNFSVPTNGSAIFDLVNTPNITTIFSRVTGGNISNIDGLIKTINNNPNNAVSLFLMNPNGIIFGQNAKLDISGSFVGTTANSIKFSDGVEFSAANPKTTPLLTMSVPIGLQMGSNPAPMTVQGTGYKSTIASLLSPSIRTPSPTELRVKPGKTLALVGGNLNLNGATLTAEQGQIQLGSLGSAGLVNLIPITQGYTLGYENGQSFGNIQLAQKSLIDVSGINAGSVQVQAKKIQFTNSSLILAKNLGNLPGGNLHLQASEEIDLIGTFSGVRSETLSSGNGANISVITPRLSIQQGATLNSITYGKSTSGNIHIDATNLEISGFSLLNTAGSLINTSTVDAGNAGNIFVNGDSLLVSNGGGLSSISKGKGSSGEVIIHNLDTIVQGRNGSPISTRISSTTFNIGNAKTLTLDTARLQLLDGGEIVASSFFAGHGGNIRIDATESVLISGSSQSTHSRIRSSAQRLSPASQKLFGIPDNTLTADAGKISITTPNLTLKDRGTLSVANQGSGDGGSINIIANTIQLKDRGAIEAKTASGNGGSIGLQVGNLLLLRESSQITATAQGNGNGGNININAPILVGLENSDIIANAFKGKGGNINITTEGIIGLEFRDTLTPRTDLTNDITASSQFNLNGNVEINNVGVDPNSGLIELPANLSDASQQIASGCDVKQGSSFVATGRGGIPENPNQEVRTDRPWSDIRDISTYRKTQPAQAKILPSPETLIQATSWRRNAQGKVELVAAKSSTPVQTLSCSGITK
ncbi:beta strand repeat-containing protein [Calothrix sp. 336/3]|uniref:beta strand repeat-containing protein n=1 Tax=Calothrix sp. 336/3 TaxID=1337936 RepID=UPI0006247817|nr:S-layer family protein [Calothrix sp. 336/3]AKG24549.1 filamentous hemagglutinin [Calothrix sp. 336/3]